MVGLSATLVFLGALVASAEELPKKCDLLTTDHINTVVQERGGEAYIYRVSSDSIHWRVYQLGYHGGVLACRTCIWGSPANAMFWLSPLKKRLEKPNFDIRQKALNTAQYFSWMERKFDRGRIRSQPDEFSIGDFRGWSLAIEAIRNGEVSHDVIEIAASDGCARFNVRIEAEPATDDAPLSNVRSMLSALQITKFSLEDYPDRSVAREIELSLERRAR